MTIRTTRATITFRSSFKLTCFVKAEPAGDYQLETDEELIEGVSVLAYRRVKALLHVPRGSGSETFTIDPKELEAALKEDLQS
jgi:hypothetical protein